jgi:hypothetical protein
MTCSASRAFSGQNLTAGPCLHSLAPYAGQQPEVTDSGSNQTRALEEKPIRVRNAAALKGPLGSEEKGGN